MDLTRRSVELLLDLVEIKIGLMQVHDREDAREYKGLRKCRDELLTQIGHAPQKKAGRPGQRVVQFPNGQQSETYEDERDYL